MALSSFPVPIPNSIPTTYATMSEASLLAGVNVLVEGPTGTGKTTALATIAEVDPSLELFVLFTENGLETFVGYWTDKGLPVPPNVHWHVLPKPPGSFKVLGDSADKINTMTQESLHKMQDPDRAKHNQYVSLLRAMSDFPDDRTGTKFGPVDSWGPNRVVGLDSLSGLNPIALSLVVGGKPVKSQPDWGIAQDQIEKFVRQCTDGCRCHFVLTAHVEREIDQVFGGAKITVSTLGVKLAPKLPPMFSDVILSQRIGTAFSWSTANPQADLKARNLPYAENIAPDFKQIFNKWQSRGGKFTATVKS
jgi:hypothetical protein